MSNLVAVFPVTHLSVQRDSHAFTRRGRKLAGAARVEEPGEKVKVVVGGWGGWGVTARRWASGARKRRMKARTRGVTDSSGGGEKKHGRVSDATAGGMAARQESLRDQEGWRVNDYTRSQYLTGPTPCPSVLHPDSREGRAKNLAIVSLV